MSRFFAVLVLSLVVLVGLFPTSAWSTVNFYAADYSGNHLYYIDGSTWDMTNLGTITNSPASPTYPYSLSMDFDPDGNLYLMRGRGNISGKPANIFALDPDTRVATVAYTIFSTGIGSGTAADSALTFRDDGTFLVLKNGISQRPIVMDDFNAATPSKTFTQGSNPTHYGMEWYDDGSANGIVYAIQAGSTPNGSAMVLNTLNINYASTGYSTGFFATGNYLPPGFTSGGDLCIVGDTLYVMVASVSASKLYSYDLTQGAGGSYNWLGDYSVRLAALAGEYEPPPQVPSVPEPASMLGLLMGVTSGLGMWCRRRR